jgi:hypothetical protein
VFGVLKATSDRMLNLLCRFYAQVEQLEQKKEKRQRSVLYEVTQRFNGALCPLSFGCRVLCCPPCMDEQRLKLEVGDKVLASRFRKYVSVFSGTRLSRESYFLQQYCMRHLLARLCMFRFVTKKMNQPVFFLMSCIRSLLPWNGRKEW